jgi:hypothetical protein
VFSKTQAAGPIESISKRLARVVMVELPAWQLLVLAAVVGVVWAAGLFDLGFLTGQDAFWQFPEGTIAGSRDDMAQVLVGYFYYVQSPWRLPLFYVSNLGTPAGTNVIFMDVVPIVAFIGKLVHSLTGATINLYGGYLVLCFVLPGVMMALVLIAAKIRYGIAAVIAAIFADTMPTLLWRWGHIALMAQFLLIGALALYLFSLRRRVWRGRLATWVAYLVLAYLIDQFLFVMVGIVWLCALIQRRLSRYTTTQEALGTAVLTVASVSVLIALGGQFSPGSPLPFSRGYGGYSMNLLSPFLPQDSGLFPGLGGLIDATGGQHEGFNYLGIGLLIASLLLLPAEVGWLRRNLRRHILLLVACMAMAALSMSHRVFAGNWLLFEFPIPSYIVQALGMFRSSGRLFWLIGYAQVALVIVLGFRRTQPVAVLCLIMAATLQVLDVQPLRERIIASIAAGPGAEELDRGEIATLIAGARHVEVVPSFQCTSDRDVQDPQLREKRRRANMDLMLAAAMMNVPTNTVYLARQSFGLSLFEVIRAPSRAVELRESLHEQYCDQEIEYARSGRRAGELLMLLSDRPRQEEIAAGVACSPLSWARYCVRSER